MADKQVGEIEGKKGEVKGEVKGVIGRQRRK